MRPHLTNGFRAGPILLLALSASPALAQMDRMVSLSPSTIALGVLDWLLFLSLAVVAALICMATRGGQVAQAGLLFMGGALMMALRSSLALSALLETDTTAHDLSYVFGIAGSTLIVSGVWRLYKVFRALV
ncbi:MAG: hypothetical protein HY558_08300 [Euryarchaeota archaeon]|nr:hypothetical protein [Euryarchaeota archaeon]